MVQGSGVGDLGFRGQGSGFRVERLGGNSQWSAR